MKLAKNEVVLKDSAVVLGSRTIGCTKTKRDIMLSFTRDQEEFDYVDVFLTKEQAEELIINLRVRLDELV